MGEMAADRVYDDRREATTAYVASGQGVARIRVAGDRVGRFALAHRCAARDVTAGDGRVYVATDGGVLAGPDPFESLGFDGGAVAVGAGAGSGSGPAAGGEGPASDGDGLLAADEAGTVRRYRNEAWTTLGRVDDVRALDGGFVAAGDGIYRVAGDDLTNAGLSDVRDVAADGVPLAATGDGLYRLGNGWLCEREGAFEAVGADSAGDGGDWRAHAATADRLLVRREGTWSPVELPVDGPVADVAYGECVYAVTTDGTFLVDAAPEATVDGTGGWRSRSLGLPGVRAVAVA